MNGYPITLNLKDKNVVVIGGGKVAYRKIVRLLEYQANITIVSPSIIEPLQKITAETNVAWVQDTFKQDYIKEAVLIFAATNDKQVNEIIFRSKKPFQWINIADDPEHSDFHLPATFNRGRLSIAVSTSGASPILARKIKNEIGKMYDESYVEYVNFLYDARTMVKEQVKNEQERKAIFHSLANVSRKDIPYLKKYLAQLLKIDSTERKED